MLKLVRHSLHQWIGRSFWKIVHKKISKDSFLIIEIGIIIIVEVRNCVMYLSELQDQYKISAEIF